MGRSTTIRTTYPIHSCLLFPPFLGHPGTDRYLRPGLSYMYVRTTLEWRVRCYPDKDFGLRWCLFPSVQYPPSFAPTPITIPHSEPTGRDMESVTSRFDPRSHKTQLVFTTLAASVLTVAAITSYNSYSLQKKRNELNRQVLNSVTAASSSDRGGSGCGRKRRGTSPPWPEHI